MSDEPEDGTYVLIPMALLPAFLKWLSDRGLGLTVQAKPGRLNRAERTERTDLSLSFLDAKKRPIGPPRIPPRSNDDEQPR